MTIRTWQRASLALAACAWLTLGCSGRPAGCRGPGPGASNARIDGSLGAGAGAPTPPDARPDTTPDDRTKTRPDARPALARGVTRGAFVEVQEGDYVHLVIRDRAGSLQSFFLAPALPAAAWEPFLTGRHRGKPVAITWEEVRIYVPEAGAEQTIRQATAIRLIE
jgi:hypothetical protein